MENIINVEFFDQKSSAMKHVYFVHSLLGGVLYEDYVTPQIQYLARILASFAYLTSTIALITYLCQPEPTFKKIQFSAIQLVLFQMWMSIGMLVYLKRDTFHALFDHMNDDINNPDYQHTNVAGQQKSLKNFNLKLGRYLIAWILTIYTSMLCNKLATDEGEFHIEYDWDFITPFPFTDSQSFVGYIAIFHLTFTFFLFYAGIMYASNVLPIMLSMHLENQTIRLRNDINYHTELTFECLEECFRREEQLVMEPTGSEDVREFLQREILKRRDRHIEEFMLKVNQWIEMHQKWIM